MPFDILAKILWTAIENVILTGLNGLPCEGNSKQEKILEYLRGEQSFILKGTNSYYRGEIRLKGISGSLEGTTC